MIPTNIANRKKTALILATMFLIYGIASISSADETEKPHFHEDTATRAVVENVAIGTNVGNPVTAHSINDADRYVLANDAGGAFTIDKQTGQLKTATELDHATKSSYLVWIKVENSMLSPLSNDETGPIYDYIQTDEIKVTINVTPKIGPYFQDDSITFSIAEDAAIGTTVGTVSAHNFGDLDRYVLSVESGTFSINSQTGELTTKTALDYEKQTSYSLVVEVQGKHYAVSGTGEPIAFHATTDSINVTVNVTDVVETIASGLYFNEGSHINRSIAENSPAGTNIGAPITATSDSGKTLSYSVGIAESWSDKGIAFDIDSSTGQLKTSSALDYETLSLAPAGLLAVTVIVTDGVNTVLTAVTITVTNVNEAPVFGGSSERQMDTTFPGNDAAFGDPIVASDDDITQPGADANPKTPTIDTLTYTLSGTHSDLFTIDSSTGQLKTKPTLTYQPVETFNVVVTVSDSSLTASVSLVIKFEYDDSNNSASEADAAPTVSSTEIAQIIALLTMDKVIFNEIYNASNDAHDWLEFRNISDAAIDLTGWQFTLRAEMGGKTITFPAGAMLPVGGVLLLVNTAPSAPDMPLADTAGGAMNYIVDETFNLPATDFALILQGADGGYEDCMGNYFPNRSLKPASAVPLTADVVWYRAKPALIGYQTEAWIESGYSEGLGYDDDVPKEMRLGTPGYRHRLTGDLNNDGVVNILDLVLIASQFGQTDAPEADLNSDGTVDIEDLVIAANSFGTL